MVRHGIERRGAGKSLPLRIVDLAVQGPGLGRSHQAPVHQRLSREIFRRRVEGRGGVETRKDTVIPIVHLVEGACFNDRYR